MLKYETPRIISVLDKHVAKCVSNGQLHEALAILERLLGSREYAITAVNVIADRIGVPGIRR